MSKKLKVVGTVLLLLMATIGYARESNPCVNDGCGGGSYDCPGAATNGCHGSYEERIYG